MGEEAVASGIGRNLRSLNPRSFNPRSFNPGSGSRLGRRGKPRLYSGIFGSSMFGGNFGNIFGNLELFGGRGIEDSVG
jgi:hypothetical protein